MYTSEPAWWQVLWVTRLIVIIYSLTLLEYYYQILYY